MKVSKEVVDSLFNGYHVVVKGLHCTPHKEIQISDGKRSVTCEVTRERSEGYELRQIREEHTSEESIQ